jgi:hypothetical protein
MNITNIRVMINIKIIVYINTKSIIIMDKTLNANVITNVDVIQKKKHIKNKNTIYTI